MPATLEKKRTASGINFFISSEGENVNSNFVLSEKLHIDFDIELPIFDNMKIEDYFVKIEKSIPSDKPWHFRRQVALGVFPSAKMSMYHDLDTSNWKFADNAVIKALLAGNTAAGIEMPFADDYNVDEPQIESKVPFLITDADSSQFSTIVDVVDGKNLAVEGPPGSGKSQTIVNTIASAMLDGKKVLFVAEKIAALEVVRSRLNALKLGEFILPLLATRSSRAEIIESIRERVELDRDELNFDIKNMVSDLKRYRTQINEYIGTLSSTFSNTDMTVHKVLGKCLMCRDNLPKLPDTFYKYHIDNITDYTTQMISDLLNNCDELEKAEVVCLQTTGLWDISNAINLDPFSADDILYITRKCVIVFNKNTTLREQLLNFNIDDDDDNIDLNNVINDIIFCEEHYVEKDAKIALRSFDINNYNALHEFYKLVKEHNNLMDECTKYIYDIPNSSTLDSLINIIEASDRYKINNISNDSFDTLSLKYDEEIRRLSHTTHFVNECIEILPELKEIAVKKIFVFCYLANQCSKDVLAFRNSVFEDPLLPDYLKKQEFLAKNIVQKKHKLSEYLRLDVIHDVEKLKICHENLTTAGIFRFLSKQYGINKKYYRTISKHSKFKLKRAILELSELIDVVERQKEFEQISKLKEIFRLNYDGINTSFDLAYKTVKFYNNIDEEFSGHSDKILRDFLKEQSLETIKELPKPDEELSDNIGDFPNFQSIFNKLKHVEKLREKYKSDYEELKRNIEVIKPPQSLNKSKLRNIIESIRRMHEISRQLDNDKIVKVILGVDIFQNVETDLEYLSRLLELIELIRKNGDQTGKSILNSVVEGSISELRNILTDLNNNKKECHKVLIELSQNIDCDENVILEKYKISGVADWAEKASNDRDGLINYSKLTAYKKAVTDYGLEMPIESFLEMNGGYKGVRNTVEWILYNSIADVIYDKPGEVLSKYHGLKLNSIRSNFAKIDKKITKWSGYHIANELVKNAGPPAGKGCGPKRDWTDYSLIQSEISKKKRFISPRDLAKRAGKALLELKPCWMMSPLSVAQYIQKGDIEFDLLIIDEASQMTPENAIGALARCKQAMVVGDTNQLPPSNFFGKFITVDEDDEEDSVVEESILEIANATFRPARRLRWHYRSRHSSLIAFSNKHIYKNDLTIFPSANEDDETMGVSLVKVDGLYSTGTNPLEAEVMVDHIIKFMKEHPERSLGVVTVNIKQRDLIEEEFDFASSTNSSAQSYIEKWEDENEGLESFFIKNLENVQGDERDVIFIGTVYGPASEGARVMQRFGPISGVAGRRRLNVLFTRAKKQIVTFSSMTAADVIAEESANPGAYLLKQWLLYSATNIIETGEVTNREPDSELEEYVIKQIESMGFTAVPQVGVVGYFIDIGVKHPKWPNGFILGVECDGASYHSSKSARDRDRLREEVLTNRGWNIYRIWSTDWFDDPRREAQKLREEIQGRYEKLTELDIPAQSENVTTAELEEVENIVEEIPQTNFEIFQEPEEIKDDKIDGRQATVLLRELRDNEIVEEFDNANTETGILNGTMINLLIDRLPTTASEFRASIPLENREKIDYGQMIYLHSILDILKRVTK